MKKHNHPKPLTEKQIIEITGVGGEGIMGRGRLSGELCVEGQVVLLITANKGTRSQVSFTLDVWERKAGLLEGRQVTVSGIIHKRSPWVGTITHATFLSRSGEHHLPGEHLALSGTIDNRALVGPGGEAPPSGSYLLLVDPLAVGSSTVKQLFLEGRTFDQGRSVKLYGRLEARTYGGVEIGSHPYVALSGISDLGAGEPWYDGAQFHSAESSTPLRVLVLHRRDLYDAPNGIAVLDPTQKRAFLGSMGGRMRPEFNPFYGFSESAPIAEPTDADRAAVVFNKAGILINVATGAELLKVGEEQPPPGTADMFSHAWYFDDGTESIHAFVSGGIAGFVNRMQSVVHFEGAQPD